MLHERALHGAPIDPALELLFERGIDPRDGRRATTLGATTGPSAPSVRRFGARATPRVIDDFAHATLDDPSNPLLVGAEALFNILEHEEMHHETLIYIINRLPRDAQARPGIECATCAAARAIRSRSPPAARRSAQRRGERRSAGTTSSTSTRVDVAAFGIDAYDVTNGDYLAFVRDGGTLPPFWIERDGAWYCAARGSTRSPLPLELARVRQPRSGRGVLPPGRGARLPTEAEYHRAAYGTPDGERTRVPVGRRRAAPRTRQLRLPPFRSRTRRQFAGRRERLGRRAT